MRSIIFSAVAMTALLTGSALAGSKALLAKRDLARIIERQESGAFIPPTSTIDECASDQVECGRDQVPQPTCYRPSRGQICCSDGHACPEDSFCLFAPYCCPNGLSPTECAAQYGVTLPPDFITLVATAEPTATPSSAGAVNASVPYTPRTSAQGGNTTISTPTTPVLFTGNTTISTPTTPVLFTGNTTISTPTTPVLFTGAANLNNIADVGGIAAAVLGALGMLGLAL